MSEAQDNGGNVRLNALLGVVPGRTNALGLTYCDRCGKGPWGPGVNSVHTCTPSPYIAQIEAERDRYRAALIRLRDCDWVITLHDRMDAVRAIAREALDA